MINLWLSLQKAIFGLISILYLKYVQQTCCHYNFINSFCIILLFCKIIFLSTMIFIQRFFCFIIFCRFVNSIDITSLPTLRLFCIYFSAFLLSISRQAKQISIFYAFSNLLALIFFKRNFYILSNILAYIQDFLVNQDLIYIYINLIKQIRILFQLGFIFIKKKIF